MATILFVLFVGPGPVLVLVPWLLTGFRIGPPFFGWSAARWIGAALIAAGLPVLAAAMILFVRVGRGTPAPIYPTERLIVMGPYRYVRNPMYVAVVSILVGEALVLGSVPLLAVAGIAFSSFHLFVLLYEEPKLARRFGDAYAEYRRGVSRWLPRATPWRGRAEVDTSPLLQ